MYSATLILFPYLSSRLEAAPYLAQATLVTLAHLVVEIANVIQHLVPDLHDVPGVVAFLVTPIAAGDLVVVSVVVDELGHGER